MSTRHEPWQKSFIVIVIDSLMLRVLDVTDATTRFTYESQHVKKCSNFFEYGMLASPARNQ